MRRRARLFLLLLALPTACGEEERGSEGDTRVPDGAADADHGGDAAPPAPLDARPLDGGGVADATVEDAAPPDAAAPARSCVPGPRPPIAETLRFLLLSDSAGENPSHVHAWPALLVNNDDALFPTRAGRDLTRRFPAAGVGRVGGGGLSFRALAEDPRLACDPGVECYAADDLRPTTIIVQLGTEDVISILYTIATDPFAGDDPSAAIAEFAAHVRTVLALADDPAYFGRRPALVVVDLPDPTDGTGTLDPQVAGAAINGAIDPALVRRALAGVQSAIRDEALRCGATVVAARDRFLGHGFEHDDPANLFRDAADPTLWLLGLTEPNLRGAHELRAAIWEALTGEPADEPAPALPVQPRPGELPDVPERGWANTVVDSAITPSIQGDRGPIPNVATDPTLALGPPGGGPADSAVALGVRGAYLVVDLGEGEEATDGPGPDLVVWETGPRSGGAPEPYRVSVAADPAGPFVQLGDGGGERAFDLAGAPVGRVRYVRVESRRVEVDVFRSPGSPLYPGGEIDAIGAVHLP